MIKQLIHKIYKKSNSKSEFDNDYNINKYKVIRKDGTEVIKFNNPKDALEFAILLNKLYIENNINDQARVISN